MVRGMYMARCNLFSARIDVGALHGIRCSACGRTSTYPMGSAAARDAMYARCCVGGARCPIREQQRAGMEDGELIQRMIVRAQRRRCAHV